MLRPGWTFCWIASCLLILLAGIAGCSTTPIDGNVKVSAQPLQGVALDHEVLRLMQAAKVPGLAMAVIDDGRITHLEAYGTRNAEDDLPLNTDTVMYGASLTKATFAYMVMTMVDDGMIDLDKPLAGYLPEPLPAYPDYAELASDPRWRDLTPRMLLAHTSGFQNWRFLTQQGELDEAGRLDIDSDPGSRFAYSGEGIQLLQFVIETGLGLDVGELMQARVFDRFGMRRTSLVWRDDFSGDHAVGYDALGTPLGHNLQDNVRAAGSMDTTVDDYARFLAGLQRGEGLSEDSRDEMLRPQIAIHAVQQFPTRGLPDTRDNDDIELSYGLGWGVFESAQGKAWFKEGHDEKTSNYVLCLETSRVCLLLLSNSANAEGIFKYVADAVLGPTCLPWYWENYIPYDHPELHAPMARQQPHPPCTPLHGASPRID